MKSLKLSTKISLIAICTTLALACITTYILNKNLQNTLFGEQYINTVYIANNTLKNIIFTFGNELKKSPSIQKTLQNLEKYAFIAQKQQLSQEQQTFLQQKNINITQFTNDNIRTNEYGVSSIDTFTYNDSKGIHAKSFTFKILPGERLLLQMILQSPNNQGYTVASTHISIRNTPLYLRYIKLLENTNIESLKNANPAFMSMLQIPNETSLMQNLQSQYITLIQNYLKTENPQDTSLFYHVDEEKNQMFVLSYSNMLNCYSITTLNITPLLKIFSSFRFFSFLFIAAYALIAIGIISLCINKALQPFEKIVTFFYSLAKAPIEHTPLDSVRLRKQLLIEKECEETQIVADTFLQLLEQRFIQHEKIRSLTSIQESFLQEYTLAQQTQNLLNANLAKYHKNPEVLVHSCNIQEYTLNSSFYDSYFIDQDTLFIALGESRVRSIASSIILSYIQGLLHTEDKSNLGKIVDELNTIVKENTTKGIYIDLFIGVLDITTGVLRYINAGKNPPLLMRNGVIEKEAFETLYPVGEWESLYINPTPITLQEGDTLLFYTQGLFHILNSERKHYTKDKLEEFLIQHKKSTADILTKELEHNLHLFSAGVNEPREALCLCFQYKPTILREQQLYSTMVGIDKHALSLQEGSIYTVPIAKQRM